MNGTQTTSQIEARISILKQRLSQLNEKEEKVDGSIGWNPIYFSLKNLIKSLEVKLVKSKNHDHLAR